jgi:hypothetical protein
VIIFGLVWFLLKKNNQTEFFFLKNQTSSHQPVSVWFGFLGQNRFDSVFSSLAQFFRLGSVFPGFFCLGSVRFGFFFRLIKPKPNQTDRFYQNCNQFNRFFSRFGFFTVRFFSGFLGLIGFSIFLLTPNQNQEQYVRHSKFSFLAGSQEHIFL